MTVVIEQSPDAFVKERAQKVLDRLSEPTGK
jgi:hypothetical protein